MDSVHSPVRRWCAQTSMVLECRRGVRLAQVSEVRVTVAAGPVYVQVRRRADCVHIVCGALVHV